MMKMMVVMMTCHHWGLVCPLYHFLREYSLYLSSFTSSVPSVSKLSTLGTVE